MRTRTVEFGFHPSSRSVLIFWAIGLLACLLPTGCAAESRVSGVDLSRVDHLVYGTPDLDATVDELERRLGVRATPGGRHPGQGTRNAVLALGPTTYLEILGPDPEQPEPDRPRWLGIDDLTAPRLVAWAAKASDLSALVADARQEGIELGDVLSGSRRRPDGTTLTWQVTDPHRIVAGGVVPFFIDWGETPHPAQSAASGLELTGLRGEHPDVARVGEILGRLGLKLPIDPGSTPALIATLQTPRGIVELR